MNSFLGEETQQISLLIDIVHNHHHFYHDIVSTQTQDKHSDM